MSARPQELLHRLLAGESKGIFQLLLVGDFVFVVLIFLPALPALPDGFLHMGHDGSLAEWFQYAKAGAVAWLLFGAARRLRSGTYALWSLLFVYLAIDDAVRIHETLGGNLMGQRWFLSSMGDAAYHYGQLLYAIATGAITLALLAWAWSRGEARDRSLTRAMAWLLGGFVGCAVGLDFLSGRLHSSGLSILPLELLFGLGEEFGEHLFLSACVWAAVIDTRRGTRLGFPA